MGEIKHGVFTTHDVPSTPADADWVAPGNSGAVGPTPKVSVEKAKKKRGRPPKVVPITAVERRNVRALEERRKRDALLK